MKSITKFEIDNDIIFRILEKAKIKDIINIEPLVAGEFNSAYCITTKGMDYVLKVSPKDGTRVLTYEKDLMRQEIYYYKLIKDNTDVDIPDLYFYDFDRDIIPADYFIMQKINMQPLTKLKLSKEDRKKIDYRIGESIAKLHTISVKGYGYRQNKLYDNWYDAIRSMIANISADLKDLGKRQFRVKDVLKYIDSFKDILIKVNCDYTHYDIWAGNIFCNKSGDDLELILIDMERSYLGDRLGDFVSLKFLVPFDKKKDIIDGYNSVALNKIEINREEKIRYYIVQAYLGLIINSEKFVRYNKVSLKYLFNTIFSRILLKQALIQLKKLSKENNG